MSMEIKQIEASVQVQRTEVKAAETQVMAQQMQQRVQEQRAYVNTQGQKTGTVINTSA